MTITTVEETMQISTTFHTAEKKAVSVGWMRSKTGFDLKKTTGVGVLDVAAVGSRLTEVGEAGGRMGWSLQQRRNGVSMDNDQEGTTRKGRRVCMCSLQQSKYKDNRTRAHTRDSCIYFGR